MNLIPSLSIPPWVKRVFCWVFSPKGGLIILLVVSFAAFVAVMCCKDAEGYIGQLLGLSGKNEILTFLGLSMGGVLLALQAVIANIRAKAMENAAKEQAKSNVYTEQGQRQERLKNAIEHLGYEKVSVRLGGAYELFHLAHDTEDKNQRQSILDILCAHIRQTTSDKIYQEDPKSKSKPSNEIQSLLTLLFMQDHDVFKGLDINLQGSWLNGAYLYKARLETVDLLRAHLQGAWLSAARLQGAKLIGTQLQGATLSDAKLLGATLTDTRLQGSNLRGAQLQGSWLAGVKLQGAELENAMLQGALLYEVFLQGAVLGGVQLHGVTAGDHIHTFSFETVVRDRIDKASDLSRVTFKGGLSKEDIDSLVEWLPDYAVKEVRRKLMLRIDKPADHELPENSGVITGSYTKKEAEQWIAEYNEAVTKSQIESDS